MEYTRKDYQRVERAIMNGKAYVLVDRVSRSGMTRYMRVYIHTRTGMENVTAIIGERLGRGFDKSGGPWNIKVGGGGMDMCFHLLYSFLPYEKARKWSQRYKRL